jgi:hypothetical protein
LNLKDFSNKHISELERDLKKNVDETIINKARKAGEELKENDPATYKNLEDAVSQYSGMGEDELTNQFLNMVNQQKENGTFDAGGLSQIYNSVYPMLDASQKEKLDKLMKVI